MVTEDKHIGICPVCKQTSLVNHCGDNHPTCDWKLCRNKDCEAVLDLARKRGHCKVPGQANARRTVDLAGGPA